MVWRPAAYRPSDSGAHVYEVVSAQEMYEQCMDLFPGMDGAILAAAVSDFTPVARGQVKTKRGRENWSLELKRTRDIAAELGARKTGKQWLVGFALEDRNELENAQRKLRSKNLDLIVLNSMKDPGAGFGGQTNKITIIDRELNTKAFDLKSKEEVARDIVAHLKDWLKTQ